VRKTKLPIGEHHHVLLTPDRNVWRVERAERAAVLVDANYFGALRGALLKAQSTVFMLGWDLDSRTRLVGESGKADDGFPEGFADFLTALVNQRPHLTFHLLMWDYSLLYATEREPLPAFALSWRLPPRIRYCLDDELPVGASHHQKVVVVDDAVAFSGGQDVTVRRWDTTGHRLDDPRRVDPAGEPYHPYHDVQAMVDGRAALALAELVRDRWSRGACEDTPPIRPLGDPWPDGVAPDFTDIDVGIARTYPASDDETETRECEALFFDSIDRAERTIYIENQYLTATRFAQRLAERMLEKPALEAVVVAPKMPHSWLEAQTMHVGLARFMGVLEAAGLSGRVALLYPQVTDGVRAVDTMIHSKVMIVDDALLRVGSANLNRRSFGLDTECDLAFEARTPTQRRAVLAVRDRMLGHFCGTDAREIAASLARTDSLIATARTVARSGHSLQPIDLSGAEPGLMPGLESVADPDHAIEAPAFLQNVVGARPRGRRLGRLLKVIGIGLLIVALAVAWHLTPLATLTDPEHVRQWFADIAEMPGALLIVLVAFVVGGLLVFPVMLLIAATAATFGPYFGFAYASLGALASASITYAIGFAAGRRTIEALMGPRLHRVRRGLVRRGVLAVAAVRLVPIAPFTVVNLVAGASRIPFVDYLFGTIIGMAPGIVLMSALGHRIFSILTEPTLANILLFILAVLAWLAVSIGVQAIILRWRRADP
jgi:phospholipase D1/2